MSGRYLKSPEEFSLLSDALACVMSVLNMGRTGNVRAAIYASRRGYKITVAGAKIAEGKTPNELLKNFQTAVDAAKAVKSE
jgi:hypothetical protein